MKAQELFEIIKTRRAVMPNLYSEDEITVEEMKLILESANWAPTHKHTEPGRYRILEGKALKRFSEFMTQQYKRNTTTETYSERKKDSIVEKCLKSNKIILICIKNSGKIPEWEETASVATAVQNMWLMCTTLGIGSYWSTPVAISNMNEFTEFEENERCIGIFYMGKLKTELFNGQREPIEGKIKFINH